LSILATSGGDLGDELGALAGTLAEFHSRAARSEECDRAARAEATLARWDALAVEMAPLVGRLFDREIHQRVLSLVRRYLAGRAPLFDSRVDAGRARDGHGDLLADDVFCLSDGPRVLDCLEFDDRLRFGDVLGDVASLAMDLERLGRRDLAHRFVGHYRSASGDDWPSSLEHHYVAYRAQVRALVAGLRFDQGETDAAPVARRLLELSRDHLEAGRVRLVVVGGLPGSGKSTLAAQAASVLDAVVLRSDEVRKRLAGLDPTTAAPAPFGEGLYGPQATAATYRELVAQAGPLLAMGRSVVMDATFSDPAWRARARALAEQSAADLDELRCVAPLAVIEARVAERTLRGGDPSDATVAVARELAAVEQPWPEAAPIATDAPPDTVRGALMDLLGVGPQFR